MCGFFRLAFVGVVVASGVAAFFVVDWSRGVIESPADVREAERRGIEPSADIREAERSRRAERPADPKRKNPGLTYDAILEGRNSNGALRRAKPAEPMPPTSCYSIEPAPKHDD